MNDFHSPLTQETFESALAWSKDKICSGIFHLCANLPKAYGSTNGCKVLMKALEQMKGNKKAQNQSIFLFTDGEFTDNSLWSLLKEYVTNSGVKVHTVLIESGYINS